MARSGDVPAPSAPSAASRSASCWHRARAGASRRRQRRQLPVRPVSREQHLDEVPAALVQLAGEMHAFGDQLGRAGLLQQLCGEPGDVGLLVDQIVEGQQQRGLGADARVDRLHRHARLLSDLLHRRAGEAALGEQPPRRTQDLAASLRRGHLTPAGTFRAHVLDTPVTRMVLCSVEVCSTHEISSLARSAA